LKSLNSEQQKINFVCIKKLVLIKYFSDDDKIYGVYDYCHIFKSVRNTLLSGKVTLNNDKVSSEPIIRVFKQDLKSASTKIMPKITKIHLFPNDFQKMNVARAVQLLSRTVSKAILSKLETSPNIFYGIPRKTVIATANFCGNSNYNL
jgi:hypothetical protein